MADLGVVLPALQQFLRGNGARRGEQSQMESKPEEAKPKDDKDSLKTLAMPELMKKLGASADGLTQAEATKRQAQYGPNQIEEKKTNEYLKFLSYFWGPIPWMIEAP
jgi:H+-transporting ATPase